MLDIAEIRESLSGATILDCTLRDGGYSNNWNFSREIVEKLFVALSAAGVHEVEVGFRTSQNLALNGPHAFSTDEYVSGFQLPSGLNLWVMVNASELMGEDFRTGISNLFGRRSDSPISGVRIAAVARDLPAIVSAARELTALGYRVALNLMQAASTSTQDIEMLSESGKRVAADVLYLADTNGSMSPRGVEKSVLALSKNWDGSIGFHAHDNLGFALINSVVAARSGAGFLDSTVAGLGRGAGNLRTEEVMVHRLGTKSPEKLGFLFDLATKDLSSTGNSNFWGYSPFFVVSGLSNIHPDYASETIESSANSSTSRIMGLSRITTEVAKKYNKNFLADTLALDEASEAFDLKLTKRHSQLGRVILLGPGTRKEDHQAILEFRERNKMRVFALNLDGPELEEELSGRFFASLPRFIDSNQFLRQTSRGCVIAPFDRLTSAKEELKILRQNPKMTCVLYGLQDKGPDGITSWSQNHCKLDTPLAFPYALAYLATGGATEIYLAGFNGYQGPQDPRWESSQSAIDRYQESFSGQIFSLTPTNYKLPNVSPYGSIPNVNP